MSPNARLIIGVGLIELLLGALWTWLPSLSAESTTRPDAQAVIGQALGGAMGLVFALGCVIFFVRWLRK